jgi:hypothetical protein
MENAWNLEDYICSQGKPREIIFLNNNLYSSTSKHSLLASLAHEMAGSIKEYSKEKSWFYIHPPVYKVAHIQFLEYRLISEWRVEGKCWCILASMCANVMSPGVILVRTFNIGLYYIYALTNSWSWVLLEELPILQLLKNLPAFYGARRFITDIIYIYIYIIIYNYTHKGREEKDW